MHSSIMLVQAKSEEVMLNGCSYLGKIQHEIYLPFSTSKNARIQYWLRQDFFCIVILLITIFTCGLEWVGVSLPNKLRNK